MQEITFIAIKKRICQCRAFCFCIFQQITGSQIFANDTRQLSRHFLKTVKFILIPHELTLLLPPLFLFWSSQLEHTVTPSYQAIMPKITIKSVIFFPCILISLIICLVILNNNPATRYYNSVSLLSKERLHQNFYCRNIHPIPLPAGSSNHKVFVSTLEAPKQIDMVLFDNNDIVSSFIIHRGSWEILEITTLLNVLDRFRQIGIEPTFLDIGSNVGWFSVSAASMGYKTISFDAMRTNGHMFRTTLCNNPELMEKITFVNKGLASTEKTCKVISLWSNVGDGNMHCNNEDGSEVPIPDGYQVRNTVDLVRLDSYVKQDIHLIKIDVEGFEYHVLKGATEFFKSYNVPFILSEVGPNMLKAAGTDPKQYIQFLVDLGYEISLTGFDGPFLEIIRGKEELSFASVWNTVNPFNIYCRKKDFVMFSKL